jgi:galactose mutarotase-like enzyme
MSQPLFPVYELTEPQTESWFRISPERGGIMTSLGLHGRELLYMDQGTFDDPDANVRGGNPILFPISGQAADGQYEWNGHTYPMKNHGVARTLPWSIESQTSSSITVTQRFTSDTLFLYPFQYQLRFTYALKDGILEINQQYRNLGDESMPMYAGHHPYFISDSHNLTYYTDATHATEGTDVSPFTGSVDLNGKTTSVLLTGAEQRSISFRPVANAAPIRMTYGPEFKVVVLWAVPGEPFICVEPWMARPLEIHRQEELVIVPAGGSIDTFLTIALGE